ncbi:flagellar biosynthesis protein FlhB [Aliigemmobacter aestuarii]|uniref:Flagellar biosynthesis protein FlhB n=1 Tax=Aliigemmobacter aestuarii TaxID=1445661 RepID=A0A4S3MTY5_9RHOB|nr:flagellar type III secretion system protein FlhB [Gemmobacter aestuarii]THD85623.1 flagellar biosynthesis protein FlhB [Gemmobacter aestuarii]
MSEEQDASEKEHEPTPRRLEQAREKGDAPRLNDLTSAVSFLGHAAVVWLLGAWIVQQAGPVLAHFLARPGPLAAQLLSPSPPMMPFLHLGLVGATLFLVPMAVILLFLIAFKGILMTPENLMPKLSRISPIANARNKFGRTGLVEFAKNTVKLFAIAAVLIWFLKGQGEGIALLAQMPIGLALPQIFAQMLAFLALVVGVSLVIAGADHLWQKADFLHRNRMSRKELMDELKDQEGDPATKARRRQRGMDIAQNRMLADVPKADVVIVNPTHYAVALQWGPASGRAPVCLAKGVDEVAARIRERAMLAGVPIRSDPPTARAIHAVVALGEEIRPEHYRAVAAAIRYAERIRKLGKAHARP